MMKNHEVAMRNLSSHCRTGTIEAEFPIIVMELLKEDRETIDTWVNFGIDLRQNWDAETPLLILVDTSKGFQFTRYATQRAQEMMAVRPEIKEAIAVIIADTLVGRMIEMTMQLAAGMMRASLRVFRKREDALVWLLNKGHKFQDAR